MLTIKSIHSAWDKYRRPDGYQWDQDKVEIIIDKPIAEYRMMPDTRITHPCGSKGQLMDFWVSHYHNDDLLDFCHHANPEHPEWCGGLGDNHKYHSGCGYAGGTSYYTLADGIKYAVTGAWSSGEYHYNEVMPHDLRTHICVEEANQHYVWACALKISTLLTLMQMQNIPYSLVQGLGAGGGAGFEIVHNDDVAEFVENGGINPIFEEKHNNGPFSKRYQESNDRAGGRHRWLGQTHQDWLDAIANTTVYKP